MKKSLLCLLFMIVTVSIFAQGNNSTTYYFKGTLAVGKNDTSRANAGALLEVGNGNDHKGILPPRITDTNSISSPIEGLFAYDKSSHILRFFNGTQWKEIGGGGSSIIYANKGLSKVGDTIQLGGFLNKRPSTIYTGSNTGIPYTKFTLDTTGLFVQSMDNSGTDASTSSTIQTSKTGNSYLGSQYTPDGGITNNETSIAFRANEVDTFAKIFNTSGKGLEYDEQPTKPTAFTLMTKHYIDSVVLSNKVSQEFIDTTRKTNSWASQYIDTFVICHPYSVGAGWVLSGTIVTYPIADSAAIADTATNPVYLRYTQNQDTSYLFSYTPSTSEYFSYKFLGNAFGKGKPKAGQGGKNALLSFAYFDTLSNGYYGATDSLPAGCDTTYPTIIPVAKKDWVVKSPLVLSNDSIGFSPLKSSVFYAGGTSRTSITDESFVYFLTNVDKSTVSNFSPDNSSSVGEAAYIDAQSGVTSAQKLIIVNDTNNASVSLSARNSKQGSGYYSNINVSALTSSSSINLVSQTSSYVDQILLGNGASIALSLDPNPITISRTSTAFPIKYQSLTIGDTVGGGHKNTFTDEINSKGLEYASKYRSNLTARWLTDKEYVDSVVAASGGGLVTSVNSKQGVVVLGTNDIAETGTTNLYYNDSRVRAAISGAAPLTYNSGTGAFGITQSTTSTNGWLSSTDWNTFNGKYTLPALTAGSVLFSNGTTINQDNSNFFWDNTNKRLGLGTSAPTTTLALASTSTGISAFNTVDQTTNMERVRSFWNSNVYTVQMEGVGLGTIRDMKYGIANGGKFLTFSNNSSATGYFNMGVTSNVSSSSTVASVTANLTGSSSAQQHFAILGTVTQGGASTYKGLWISPQITSLGFGSAYLIDAGTNTATNGGGTHTSKFTVDTSGNAVSLGSVTGSSIKVTGGSGSQILLADGTTSTLHSSLSNGFTVTGDGTTKTFTINHTFGATGYQVMITPTALLSATSLQGGYYITAKSATHFDVVFTVAPAVGSNTFDYFINKN